MKPYKGMEVEIHGFLTPALDGGEQSAPCPGCFIVRTKGLVPTRQGLRVGLDIVKRENLLPLLGIELFFFSAVQPIA
jgi:hypothetical protein